MLVLELEIKNGPVLYWTLDSSEGRNPAVEFSLPPKAMDTQQATFTVHMDAELLDFWRKNKVVMGWVAVTQELEDGTLHTWWKAPITGNSVEVDADLLTITTGSEALVRKSTNSRLPRLRLNELLPDLHPEAPDRQEPIPEVFGTVYGLPLLLATNSNYHGDLVYIVAGHRISSETLLVLKDSDYLGSWPVLTAVGPEGEYSYIKVPKSVLGDQQTGLWALSVTGRRADVPSFLQWLANQYLPGEHKQAWRDMVASSYADQFLKSFSLGLFLNQELSGDVLTSLGQRLEQSFPIKVGFPAGKFSWMYTGTVMAPAIDELQVLIYGQDLWARGGQQGPDLSQVRNNFVYTAGYDGGTGQEKLQKRLNQTNSALCRVSAGIWGETAEETISFPDVTDLGTAHLVAEELASVGAKCPYQTTYITNNENMLLQPIGKFFALQDATWFSGNRLMRLDSVAYDSAGVYQLGVTVYP